MLVAGDPSLGLILADLPRRLPVGGRRGRGQPLVRPRHRRADGAHGRPPGPGGPDLARARRCGSASRWRRVVRRAVAARQPAGRRAVVLPASSATSFVYTIWLKRRTPQNIVIGGAAGAVPAARRLGRGHRRRSSGTAIYLFAIVFFWTPPHFWALSLLMKDEYAKVGVPMLPVVRGEAETRRQILLYTVLLYAVTQLPFCAGGVRAASTSSPRSLLGLALHLRRRACCTAAPTAAPRCGSTSSRSPTSRCCSARWSPTSSSSPIRIDRWTATSPARTSAPASSSRRLPVHVRHDLRRRGDLHLVSPTRPADAPPAGEEIHLPGPSHPAAAAAVGITMALVGVTIDVVPEHRRRHPRHRRASSAGSATPGATSRSYRSTTSDLSRKFGAQLPEWLGENGRRTGDEVDAEHRRFPWVGSVASRRREGARELTTQVTNRSWCRGPGACRGGLDQLALGRGLRRPL